MKKKAPDQVVMDFMAAVFPGAPELAIASFDEEHVLRTATETITALRAGLRRLEWRRWDSESDSRICPACGGEESVGHDTDCWLAALLPKERHE